MNILYYSIIPISIIAYILILKRNVIGIWFYLFIDSFLIYYNYNIGDQLQMFLMIAFTILSIIGIWIWKNKPEIGS